MEMLDSRVSSLSLYFLTIDQTFFMGVREDIPETKSFQLCLFAALMIRRALALLILKI